MFAVFVTLWYNEQMQKELDDSLKQLTSEMVKRLDGLCPSIYLYGSVTLDDFKEGWSDIDILVLTQEEIREQADSLVNLRQEMLACFPENKYFRSFEGVILSLDTLTNGNQGRTVYWGTSGQRLINGFSLDSFSLKQLHNSAVLMFGEDVRGHIHNPTRDELRDEVVRHYQAIRKYAQKTDRSLYSYGWLLDIARGIYTLRTGEIIAKTAAGEWALANNLCPVTDALEKALTIRKEPLRYKNLNDVATYAEQLGADIQKFADILEKEIEKTA